MCKYNQQKQYVITSSQGTSRFVPSERGSLRNSRVAHLRGEGQCVQLPICASERESVHSTPPDCGCVQSITRTDSAQKKQNLILDNSKTQFLESHEGY
eukprot:3009340-Amphidinium_carterae.1